MDYKHSCVVDAEGYYKDLVLVFLEPDEDGTIRETIQHYTLGNGERLIDTALPCMRPHAGADGLVRARWDDETAAWAEGARLEEIAAWETEHPAPEAPGPTPQEDTDAMIVDHEYRVTLLELGVN